MTYEDVLAYFGTQTKIASALGITQPTVSAWRDERDVFTVPSQYQYQIEVITRGELRADQHLRQPVPPAQQAAMQGPRRQMS